ncbi:rod shape-determining protein MreC [Clostridium estertheticum]
MERLSIESDIEKSDLIVTSGLGRIYPSGIRIGMY